MNEHLSAKLIERYHGRALSPEELLAADDHLALCEACRQTLWAETRGRATANSLRAELAVTETNHLGYERLEAYVEGKLDLIDLEIADSHLKLCAQCDAELNELRAFAAQLAASPAKSYAPADSLSSDVKTPALSPGL